MKLTLFLCEKGKPPGTAAAMTCLVTNLLVLPGLGTLMVRRWVGILQILLAVAGFFVAIVNMILVISNYQEEVSDISLYGKRIFIGIGIFMAGWVWSLLSSLLVFLAVKKTEVPGPPRI